MYHYIKYTNFFKKYKKVLRKVPIMAQTLIVYHINQYKILVLNSDFNGYIKLQEKSCCYKILGKHALIIA